MISLNRRHRIVLIFSVLLLVFISLNCAAITLKTDKYVYYKGETMKISGASNQAEVFLRILNQDRIVLEKMLEVQTREFVLERDVSFLDPDGNWHISVSDAFGEDSKFVKIMPVRESAFLVISFLSPSPVSFERGSKINVAVKVFDAQRIVDDAVVVTWNAEGKKILMQNIGKGIYSTSFDIPFSATGGFFEVRVLASRAKEEGVIGGENVVGIGVEKIHLQVKLISPLSREFVFGESLNIRATAQYPDGSMISDGNAGIFFWGSTVSMENKGGGVFEKVYPVETVNEIKNETQDGWIAVDDRYGNSGKIDFHLEPSSYLAWFLSQNYLFYAFPIIFIIYIIFISGKDAYVFVRRVGAERKLERFLTLKKKLQEDFFKKGIVSRERYEAFKTRYDTEIKPLQKKVSELKEKEKYV